MCSQDDLDLVRADGDGMYAREPHHPTMTDPPKPQIVAQAGEAYGYEEERPAGTTRPVIAQAGEAIPAGAMVQVGLDGRLERFGSRRAQEHYGDALAHARCRKALEDIIQRTEYRTSPTQTYAIIDIRNLAHAALEIPPVGTRVLSQRPHKGSLGTIVAWDHDLGLPLVEWDADRGHTEAVEAHEYTTDLNQTDFFDEALGEGRR
jgi:hypothetical protein